jgi:hypothetical protein
MVEDLIKAPQLQLAVTTERDERQQVPLLSDMATRGVF